MGGIAYGILKRWHAVTWPCSRARRDGPIHSILEKLDLARTDPLLPPIQFHARGANSSRYWLMKMERSHAEYGQIETAHDPIAEER